MYNGADSLNRASYETATFKRVVLKPGNPEARKPDRKSTHKSRYLAQSRLAVQTLVHRKKNENVNLNVKTESL